MFFQSKASELIGQCLVTGEIGPIARIHGIKIRNVQFANPSGATIVGFNEPSFCSYNKQQSANAPIWERVAFAYPTALNYLLEKGRKSNMMFGDITVVFWAESPKDEYGELFAALLDPSINKSEENTDSVSDAEQRIFDIAMKVRKGEDGAFENSLEGLDPDTKFFVLGLSPSNARLSVAFFFQDAFIDFIKNIRYHYEDLKIEKQFSGQFDQIPPYFLALETVSPKEKSRKPTVTLFPAIFRSILLGLPYPRNLYTSIIARIRNDADNKDKNFDKVNYVRVSIIKAYLVRDARIKNDSRFKEELSMSLNESAREPAYLLGRLFSVLEKAQKDAIDGIDATIKDRFFASACATPANVFPTLLRLSQHHISKSQYGVRSDRMIQEIMDKIELDNHPFPKSLSLEEQGIFILGYYHQTNALYTASTDPKNARKNEKGESENDTNK